MSGDSPKKPPDPKRDAERDAKGAPGGTGTGPAGGTAEKAGPSLPAVDPNAAADALAQFEVDEERLAKRDLPTLSAAAAAIPKPLPPSISGGVKVEPLGPPTPNPKVVVFDKVTKTYPGGFTAIKDVSFTIEDYPGRGEFVSILGPSGCGKSTVIRLIAGLLPQFPQSSGTIHVDGKIIHGPGPDRGMVFQDYTSFDNRSVLDNIAFGLECRGMGTSERYDMARHWIEKVGLSVKRDADKYPHELSGGMRQRVAIARTLILKPRLILMDEPFGALDPPTRTRMQDNLVELWREQSPTIFFITHSIEEAVYLGDHILLFSNSPGTVLQTIRVPPPDRPSIAMQRDPHFQEVVTGIRDVIDKLESSSRAGD